MNSFMKDLYISEKQFDIDMKRLYLNYDFLMEAANTNTPVKKKNIIIRIINRIGEFIFGLVEKFTKWLDENLDPLEAELTDDVKVKMDYNPSTRLKDLRVEGEGIIQSIKTNKEYRKALVKKGAKVGGVAIGLGVLYKAYKYGTTYLKNINNSIESLKKSIERESKQRFELGVRQEYLSSKVNNLEKKMDTTKENLTLLEKNVKETESTITDIYREIHSSKANTSGNRNGGRKSEKKRRDQRRKDKYNKYDDDYDY